jgi:hypothetical protein
MGKRPYNGRVREANQLQGADNMNERELSSTDQDALDALNSWDGDIGKALEEEDDADWSSDFETPLADAMED